MRTGCCPPRGRKSNGRSNTRGLGRRRLRARGSAPGSESQPGPRLPSRRKPGRPRSRASGVWHVSRASFGGWTPAHVILKVDVGLWSLRGSKVYRAVHRGLCGGNLREGFRLVEYSVQENHLHLIPEAKSTLALSRGV